MLRGSAGNIALNTILPKSMRDPLRIWDKPTIQAVFTQLAEQYPSDYEKVANVISQLGRLGATYSGGFTFSLEDLLPPATAKKYREELRTLVNEHIITKAPDTQDTALGEKLEALNKKYFPTIIREMEQTKNPVFLMVSSGVRGNPTTLKRLKFGEGVYLDNWGRPIPYPVFHSFSEGLKPAEYWASAYGSKEGIVTTKLAPGDAGAIYKQLVQTLHDLVVVKTKGESIGQKRGLPVDVNDPDNIGAFLAAPAGRFPKDTLITPQVLSELKSRRVQKILVHSPVAGGPAEGVYAVAVGARGKELPPLGALVGLEASQAIGERLSQTSVGKKHQGTVAGGTQTATQTIEKIISVPKQFSGGATHAQVDGTVENIKKAPTGGYRIIIAKQEHYVPEGINLLVKIGDKVEAGDILSEALPNPAEIVKHKGIGEGRRYFMELFTNLYKNFGFPIHRRNSELLARGLVNLVIFTKPVNGYYPNDIVKYSSLEHQWQPREGSVRKTVEYAKGMYLEEPVLHYTIGTRITPSVIKALKNFDIETVLVHNEPPPFQPLMIRALDFITKDPDFLVRLLGAYQKRSIQEAGAYGGVSKKYMASFVPSLAEGTSFGTSHGWPHTFLQRYKAK